MLYNKDENVYYSNETDCSVLILPTNTSGYKFQYIKAFSTNSFDIAFTSFGKWYNILVVYALLFTILLAFIRLCVVYKSIFIYREFKYDASEKRNCLPCIRCTAGTEFTFLWAWTMPAYMNTYLQWFIIEPDFAGIALDLSVEVIPSLAIKYGQLQDGTVTTLGYISFISSCLFMLKMLLQCLYMLYRTVFLKRILGFSAASMIAASLGEESPLMEGIELGEGIDGCCDGCFDDCDC